MDSPLVSAVYESNRYATARRLSLDPDQSEEDAGETGTVGTHRRGSSEMEMARIGGGRSSPPPPASSASGEALVRQGQRRPWRWSAGTASPASSTEEARGEVTLSRRLQ
jgi:hypothetical protein